MSKNLEFDFKTNIWDRKSRLAALCDQFMKAEVWYNENLKPGQIVLNQGKNSTEVPVLYMELELMDDELEFVKTALKNEFNRRF